MKQPNHDVWLLAIGLVYPGILCWVFWRVGPLQFPPLAAPLSAFLLAAVAIALRLVVGRLRWWAVTLFVGWLAVVVFAVIRVLTQAWAAVEVTLPLDSPGVTCYHPLSRPGDP